MFRVFVTAANPHELNITWKRYPSDLSNSTGHYKTNTTFTADSANASITLVNLQPIPDFGHYTVTACSNCTCNETTFMLSLWPCDPDRVPQPIQIYNRSVIAEPSLSDSLHLCVYFHGTDSIFYSMAWTYNGKNICPKDSSVTFNCKMEPFGKCLLTANLNIFDPSRDKSGTYTVQAVGNGTFSRNATIELSE